MAHSVIGKFAARLEAAGILTGSIDGGIWIDAFEERLPKRLPRSFSSLVRRHTFLPFEWGPIFFFGNSTSGHDHDLHVAAMHDPPIWKSTIQAGLIQFGRPAGGSYDVVCFDTRATTGDRDYPVVRLDHEAILIKGRIKIVEQVAPSFAALAESLLATASEPVAV